MQKNATTQSTTSEPVCEELACKQDAETFNADLLEFRCADHPGQDEKSEAVNDEL